MPLAPVKCYNNSRAFTGLRLKRERNGFRMTVDAVVIFVPDDTGKTGREEPLMLERVQGVPLLSWIAAALAQSGARRFFLVAQPGCIARAKACFPEELSLTVCQESDAADLLHVFLSTMDEGADKVALVTGPCVYLREPAARPSVRDGGRSAAFLTNRLTLMDALDGDFSFSRFLAASATACTGREGFYPVSDYLELLAWQHAMNKSQLFRLAREGVRIWDLDNCYVTPWTTVGVGTELLPGTVLSGRNSIGAGCTIGPGTCLTDASVGDGASVVQSRGVSVTIGRDCTVGPFANLRPGTTLGPGVHTGAFVEINRSSLGARTQVAHLAYLGDATVGQDCNIGCGVSTANFDRVNKFETQVGDNAFVGCDTCLVAPVRVGQGAYIAAGSVITQDVPDGALALGRSRQTNKKDWANKHKR